MEESNNESLNVKLSLKEFLKLLLFLIISSLWNPALLTYSVHSGLLRRGEQISCLLPPPQVRTVTDTGKGLLLF